jgi:branched-chain amino acid transport system substrate-binding protein
MKTKMKRGSKSMVHGLIVTVLVLSVSFMFAGNVFTAAAEETLKIGLIGPMDRPNTVDQIHMDELYAEMINKAGGLNIGGQKYKIKFIFYDHKNDLAAGRAAVNRLIFEDKVKFIFAGFSAVTDGLIPITEANKVVLITNTPSPTILKPNINYGFNVGHLPVLPIVSTIGFFKSHPEFKHIVDALPDHQTGHLVATDQQRIFQSIAGVKCDVEFYPPTATDLSALGTKIKKMNPDVFQSAGGGPLLDALANKAVYAAGWRGQFFQGTPSTALAMERLVPPEVLEGYVLPGATFEFDPPLTQAAKDFMAAWMAKYGKYQGELLGDAMWECLAAALQKAGSTDPGKVAAVIGNGLKFESLVSGTFQMVARPDLGNKRTADSACTLYLKKIVKGKPLLAETVPLEKTVAMYDEFNSKK